MSIEKPVNSQGPFHTALPLISTPLVVPFSSCDIGFGSTQVEARYALNVHQSNQWFRLDIACGYTKVVSVEDCMKLWSSVMSPTGG